MQHITYLVLRRMRIPLIVLICSYAVSIIGFILIPGLDGQGQPYRMNLFHAFYFVSFMGSTIGFGELPYPFTDGQRMWTLFTIYATVISWLYAIGTMIALIQSPMLQAAFTISGFTRKVRRIKEPFYLICGYGDTGSKLVRSLSNMGRRTVVIDQNANRINELELEDLTVPSICLAGNAADPATLKRAGIAHQFCTSVIAVTRSDEVNLKVAISSKLENKNRTVFCWAETHDAGANMESFGTDHIINPYDTFANDLCTALAAPSRHLLRSWLSSNSREPLSEPVFPPNGMWLLCGYGRFGKAVRKQLLKAGVPVRVIENRPDLTNPPQGSILGRGTEANTLIDAEISKAIGIIAGTNHDVNNLSIIITARELNPDLFTIARQESSANDEIFNVADIDMIAHHSALISTRILAQITTSLTTTFLSLAKEMDEEESCEVISRLAGLTDELTPHTWVLSINPRRTPSLFKLFPTNLKLTVKDLLAQPNQPDRSVPCMVLLIQRGQDYIMLPEMSEQILPYDRLLFSGHPKAQSNIMMSVSYGKSLYYRLSNTNKPTFMLGRWLTRN